MICICNIHEMTDDSIRVTYYVDSRKELIGRNGPLDDLALNKKVLPGSVAFEPNGQYGYMQKDGTWVWIDEILEQE